MYIAPGCGTYRYLIGVIKLYDNHIRENILQLSYQNQPLPLLPICYTFYWFLDTAMLYS